MSSKIVERLKEFIDSKGINIAAFERTVGMSSNSFRTALKKGASIGTDKLENIYKEYPELNGNWLLTGKGSMFIHEQNSDVTNKNEIPSSNIKSTIEDKEMKDRIKLLEKQLENLQETNKALLELIKIKETQQKSNSSYIQEIKSIKENQRQMEKNQDLIQSNQMNMKTQFNAFFEMLQNLQKRRT